MNNTATLLPISSVGIFATKKDLIKNANSLKDDWRFARVQIDVIEGDVSDAIETYKSQETHDLILIETKTIDDSFSDSLEDLAQYCSENTAAIVVGPVNDVNLYRTLMTMGVSDYLVHPIGKEDLSDVVAKALIDRLGTAQSKLISVIGAKGGVGASSIAQALALGCSQTLRQKTIIVDGAGGASYLSVAMGLEPTTTLQEAGRAAFADDDDNMKRMIVSVNDKLHVLASGGEPLLEDPISAESFENILNKLMTTYPVVIFDGSSASMPVRKTALARSHKIFLATTPTLSSMRSARAMIQEINTLRGDEDEGAISKSKKKKNTELIDLIINMKGQFSGHEITVTDAEKALEYDVSVTIDFDPKVFPAAEIDGLKITDVKGNEKILNELMARISKLIGVRKDGEVKSSPEGLISGIMSKLKG